MLCYTLSHLHTNTRRLPVYATHKDRQTDKPIGAAGGRMQSGVVFVK